MGHSTAIPGIYLAPLMSSSSLLKSGVFVTLQALQSTPSQTEQQKELCRPPNAFSRRLQRTKKDPFEGLLKYRNTPFEDIGVSPVQLLMSRRTRTMIPTHRRLLLPQAVDPDQVVKALKQRQFVSKKNFDKQSRDLPPLEAGDKVRIRPNRDTEWRKAEVLPRSYLLQDEQGRIYRRNRKQIISVPNDHPMRPQLHPMCPQLHDPSVSSPCADVPMSPSSPTTEKQTPGQMELAERPAGNAEHSPIVTRSGRQVRKPQRLIESC